MTKKNNSTQFIIGFDPGGAGNFGWCVIEDNKDLPLKIIETGIASSSAEALNAVSSICDDDSLIRAIGIDAPLFWDPDGKREVDIILREIVNETHGNPATIIHVNSLFGACLIQGMMIAMLYRKDNPSLPVTEAHPKAMLYKWGYNNIPRITLQELTQYFDVAHIMDEHARDAALSALCAWAMLYEPSGWTNLYQRFGKGTLTPLQPPPAYYFPIDNI